MGGRCPGAQQAMGGQRHQTHSMTNESNSEYDGLPNRRSQHLLIWGPIYQISYDYRKFIVGPTYDSDLKRAEISLRNIVS